MADEMKLVPVDVARHAANNLRVQYHKTRLTREVMVLPDDLSVVLDYVLAASPPAREEVPGEEEGDARELAVLLDNLVIAQSLSREWREAATDQARSYLYALRDRTSEPAREDKANHDCLAKRRPGEPMFILLGRDPDAHNIVQLWADRRLAAGGDPDHCRMGYDTAERMAAYAKDPSNRPASAPDASDYPAPATADKLKVAKEALSGLIEWAEDYMRYGKCPTFDAPGSARQALAALTEEGRS